MNNLATQGILLNGLEIFGNSVFIILSAVLSIGVAYLIYRWGWFKIKNAIDGVSYGEWQDVDFSDMGFGKLKMRRRYESDDSFDEYFDLKGKSVDPWGSNSWRP